MVAEKICLVNSPHSDFVADSIFTISPSEPRNAGAAKGHPAEVLARLVRLRRRFYQSIMWDFHDFISKSALSRRLDSSRIATRL